MRGSAEGVAPIAGAAEPRFRFAPAFVCASGGEADETAIPRCCRSAKSTPAAAVAAAVAATVAAVAAFPLSPVLAIEAEITPCISVVAAARSNGGTTGAWEAWPASTGKRLLTLPTTRTRGVAASRFLARPPPPRRPARRCFPPPRPPGVATPIAQHGSLALHAMRLATLGPKLAGSKSRQALPIMSIIISGGCCSQVDFVARLLPSPSSPSPSCRIYYALFPVAVRVPEPVLLDHGVRPAAARCPSTAFSCSHMPPSSDHLLWKRRGRRWRSGQKGSGCSQRRSSGSVNQAEAPRDCRGGLGQGTRWFISLSCPRGWAYYSRHGATTGTGRWRE